jgi:hypothetical protein
LSQWTVPASFAYTQAVSPTPAPVTVTTLGTDGSDKAKGGFLSGAMLFIVAGVAGAFIVLGLFGTIYYYRGQKNRKVKSAKVIVVNTDDTY